MSLSWISVTPSLKSLGMVSAKVNRWQGSTYWGEASSLQMSQSPPKKSSFWKKIKSYFKYWSYFTTILRNQWTLLCPEMGFQPILNTIFSKFSGGACPRSPLDAYKIFSRRCVAQKIFLGSTSPPPKQKVLDRTRVGRVLWCISRNFGAWFHQRNDKSFGRVIKRSGYFMHFSPSAG